MGNPMNGDIYEGQLRPGDISLTEAEASRFKEIALTDRMAEFKRRFQEQGALAPANDAPTRPMPKYKCHKEVWALKITAIKRDGEGENRETDGSAMITPAEEGYAPFRVEYDYLRKHNPQVGGYFVVYKDGYKSYSPAQAFEEGYTRL
jgi:hypothetical protein